MNPLNHFNQAGGAHMVNIGAKDETDRVAVASATVRMQPETAEVIRSGSAQKGDVLGVAQIAGIMAAKNTPQIIPLCHSLLLSGADVTFEVGEDAVHITAIVRTTGKTGVEMEALTAVSAAALTIYDMVKKIDRAMVIENIQLEQKHGGVSGEWHRGTGTNPNCEDGSCSVDFGDNPQGIDLSALSGLGMAKILTGDDK